MSLRAAFILCVCGVFLTLCLAKQLTSAGDDQVEVQPTDLGIVEETEKRLVLLDVTVRGPAETVAGLTREDFEIVIGGKPIEEFSLDRLCLEQSTPAASISDVAQSAGTSPPIGASYLFYFDQAHLTQRGRLRAYDLSRQLIEDLITGANRAMIISSGREFKIMTDMTSDRSTLLEAVKSLAQDTENWDTYPDQEEQRVTRVQRSIEDAFRGYMSSTKEARSKLFSNNVKRSNPRDSPGYNPLSGGTSIRASAEMTDREDPAQTLTTQRRAALARAQSVATDLAREERWRTERALTRFSIAVGRLADEKPPKAVIYFADNMRSKAGGHYLSLVSSWGTPGDPPILAADPFLANSPVPAYQRVIEEAATHEVRLYTVQAEGLVGIGNFISSGPTNTLSAERGQPGLASKRFRDAQDGLVGFAMETGGQPFLNGVSAEKIALTIEEDLGCFFLVGFDPAGLPEDKRIPVLVLVDKPKIKVQARSQLFIKGEAARQAAQLRTAFFDPDLVQSEIKLRGSVIPTGFKRGRYSALVQLVIPGHQLARASWDLGVSLISLTSAVQDTSAQLSVDGQGAVPVILETEMSFAPGPYELVMVAHETTSDQLAAFHLEGEWSDPSADPALVGPISLLQPTSGVFLRDQKLRRSGSLGLDAQTLVRTDIPVALLGMICRGEKRKRSLTVKRQLVGQSDVEFPVLELEFGKERCIVFSDTIPAGTMTSGMFRYEVSVIDAGEVIAAGDREFAALDPNDG